MRLHGYEFCKSVFFFREKEILEARMPTLDKEIKDAESLLKTLQQKEPKLADDYEKLRDQYAAATASTSNDKRRHHVLSMLMREKTNGNIPGVLGRLVSLKFRSFAYNINYLF